MNQISHLKGIRTRFVETSRLRTQILEAGSPNRLPVIFLHGNASASTIWEEMMLDLSDEYYCIAPDLRGYGQADRDQFIDAARGVMDWVDDLGALADELNLDRFHLAGHSLGGTVCWGAVAELPGRIETATLMAPGPPFGFGGIHGKEGVPNNADYSGSGAGVVNQAFAKNLRKGVRDSGDPLFSPREVMNRLFWRDGFAPAREEEILTAMMQVHCGENQYPGDYVQSDFWPGVAPGKYGPVNALSPKYNSGLAKRLVNVHPKPPVLWIHGNEDQIISDRSLSDPGYQGQLGYRDRWPGSSVYPPQPMKCQIRHVLRLYAKRGGFIREELVERSGHTPFLERPHYVRSVFKRFLELAE